MNQVIRHLTSLNNLTRMNNASGQVATLLVLLMIILLIFVLATVNIGNLGVQSTTLSNAADAGALMLGSNLATKAKLISDALVKKCGNPLECCKKKSFWSMILAVVIAVIAVVVTVWFTWGTATMPVLMAIGAIAGAAGGMIGAAIDGTPILAGAITGFMIGAAIGSMASGVVGLVGPAGSGAGASTAATLAKLGITLSEAAITAVNIGTIALGVLSTASSIYWNPNMAYNTSVTALLKQLSKDLAKLEERDRFRESAFYTALGMMVDDPNKVPDDGRGFPGGTPDPAAADINGNQDTKELVPAFYAWWHKRLVRFADVKNLQMPLVQDFLDQMGAFSSIAYCSQEDDGFISCNPGDPSYLSLRRLDYRITFDGDGNEILALGVADGSIVKLLRGLYSGGYNLGNWGSAPIPNGPLWIPGPTPADMDAWLSEDCCSTAQPGCAECSPPPAGYDWIDGLADHLRDFASIIAEVRAGESPLTTWSSWIYFFYDTQNPSDPDVIYGQLGTFIDMLTYLRGQLTSLSLPACVDGWYDASNVCGACNPAAGHWGMVLFNWQWIPDCGNCVQTPPGWPCRLASGGITIDENADNELQPALDAIDSLISPMTTFRQQIMNFVTNMDSITVGELEGLGGLNPITYVWNDIRGTTTLVVQAGNFKMPRTKTTSSWTKVCVKLVDYTDADRCWIKTTRIEPAPVVGQLGRWNPFSAFGKGVSKLSYAGYSYNHIEVKKIK